MKPAFLHINYKLCPTEFEIRLTWDNRQEKCAVIEIGVFP